MCVECVKERKEYGVKYCSKCYKTYGKYEDAFERMKIDEVTNWQLYPDYLKD